MILLANIAVLFLLSLVPGGHTTNADPHRLQRFVDDPALRKLLVAGKFDEYGAALDKSLTRNLAVELNSRGRRSIGAGSVLGSITGSNTDLSALYSTLKTAIAVASLAAELQTMGYAQVMATALSWVESGLIRKSGLKQTDFGSLYEIVSKPDRDHIDEPEARAIGGDLLHATGLMNNSYGKLLGNLSELFF